MPESTITNPNGALSSAVTTYISGLDANGNDLPLPRNVDLYRANATIVKGDCLMDVAPTATVPISVTPMTAAVATSDPWRFVGVAMAAAAAGDMVQVCWRGYCVVNHDTSDTPAAADQLCLPDATTGHFQTAAAAAAGDASVGKVMGAEIGTTNKCLAYINGGGPQVFGD